jgi:hypothetical protein
MESLWSPLGIAGVWLVLHSADYLLTIATARLRLQGDLRERVQFSGSIELNPLFQQAVERGQWLSPRFLVTLALGAVVLPLAVAYFQWVTEAGVLPVGGFPEFFCGALVVTRFAVISIHLQNLLLFRRLLRVPEASIVRLRYDRGTVLMVTRARKLEVAALCAIAWLVSGRLFLLGGMAAALLINVVIVLWGRRQAPAAPEKAPGTPSQGP